MNHHYIYVPLSETEWKRHRHFEMYKDCAFPYVGVSVDLDITEVYEAIRKQNLAFFPAFMYAMMRAANSIENFRYRIMDDQPVLFEGIDPGYVVLDKGDELFYYADGRMADNPRSFIDNYEKASETALKTRCLVNKRIDVAHISCVPWIRFNDLVQPLSLDPMDGLVKFMLGKFEHTNNKVTIPFSVTGHHGLFDGLHIGRLLEAVTGSAHYLI